MRRRWCTGLPAGLEAHALFSTDDPGAAELLAAPLLGRLRLSVPGGGGRRFRASLHAVTSGSLSLGYLHLAAPTEAQLAASVPRFIVLEPVALAVEAACAGATFEATPDAAVVVQPGRPTTLRCPPDTGLLAVGIEQPAMLAHLSRLLGGSPAQPLVFEPRLNLDDPRTSRWGAGVEQLHAELGQPASLLASGIGAASLEEFLMSALLYGHRSTCAPLLSGSGFAPERRAMAAAKQFIEMNLPDRLPLATIAAAAGVSVRTLQLVFRTELGTTPVAYIRSRRLDRARGELMAPPAESLTVTDVATRCGISHLGRFAAGYRARFGESPSETLRQHRLR